MEWMIETVGKRQRIHRLIVGGEIRAEITEVLPRDDSARTRPMLVPYVIEGGVRTRSIRTGKGRAYRTLDTVKAAAVQEVA